MLRSMKELDGYNIQAKDGEIGKAKDFLFDDDTWGLRYLVVDTGGFLTGRKVVISPNALGKPDWNNQVFPVSLTKQQIQDSPPIGSNEPITRQRETDLYQHYRWQPYWEGRTTGVTPGENVTPAPRPTPPQEVTRHSPTEGRHLKSLDDVRGFGVSATDGDIGEIEDFIVDDENWHIRYAVIDTRKWLPGKKVIVPLSAIKSIREDDSKVSIDMSKDKLKDAPKFDPSEPINRRYEEVIYDYYGRPRYWA